MTNVEWLQAEVERLTAELAVEKAEHNETTRELNHRYVELADDGAACRALRAEVERLTAELAEEKASRVMAEEAYAEASKWYAAAVAREKALRDVLNEAFRTETVRDLHDWLERAKRGTMP